MLVLVLSLLMSAPLQEAPVHVGDWLVGPLDATSCQMEAHFGDHYLLNISEDASGVGHLLFADNRLIMKEGAAKPATYSWDGWKTQHKGEFTAAKGPRGNFYLVMSTDSGFTEEMTGATGFWLRIPGIDFDDDFAIPETAKLTSALASCNAKR